MTLIETRNDVLMLVGREDFTPPRSFGGASATATHDCVAFAVGEGPVTVELTPVAAGGLQPLGEFVIEAEGLLSLRDVWNKEYDAAGVTPGLTRVAVLGDDPDAPTHVALVFSAAD
ncbi:hypothetical protein G7072_18085 [Nocardioides sp. HDW12B]|uniref:hypothetical protein n=1 Tax=Nocardioides sp. HDW12B TaxID=2714939 RepID=UPI0014088382|nr:hypothetical protein [Nocardioides sp. HDW12B]QIK67997.1 hypothetical protein G7072_18085 [Nocardioides sp. HDW12B]